MKKMETKNLVIIGLVVVVAALIVAFLFTSGVIKLPTASKYKSSEEAAGATADIGSGIEKIGSTLEEIDKKLG